MEMDRINNHYFMCFCFMLFLLYWMILDIMELMVLFKFIFIDVSIILNIMELFVLKMCGMKCITMFGYNHCLFLEVNGSVYGLGINVWNEMYYNVWLFIYSLSVWFRIN